jgi:diadenosine tetraphosphatase ApaH/serine/threonine PP2A family protein phosphatase
MSTSSPIRTSYYHGSGLDFSDIRNRMSCGEIIGEDQVIQLLDCLTEVLLEESNVLVLQSPIIICGDLHGQYEDVELLLELATVTKGSDKFLFMGDYVDRGHYSLNTFLLLTTYKLEYRTQYFLLRGNHETRQITRQYGFHQEVFRSYGHYGIWLRCMEVFDLLPYAALIDGDIFSVHGGISPRLIFIEQLFEEQRVEEIPTNGVLTDLAWSDPEESDLKGFRGNQRGAGYLFGRVALREFCQQNQLRLVTRSHQLVQIGFQWFFGEFEDPFPGKLINVWSAPNYCYISKNQGSFLRLRYPGKVETELTTFCEASDRIRIGQIDPITYFA